MEKAYLVQESSEYYKDVLKYIQPDKEQSKFVFSFLDKNNIQAERYYLCGDGCCNKPFLQEDKGDISLSIIPTDEDKEKLSKSLCKPDQYGLCSFKKNSKIGKEFAQYCIDNKIIINLLKPRIGDYFESKSPNNLSLGGYRLSQFEVGDNLYVKLDSHKINEETKTPEGFVEIKLSEFYKKLEEYENGR
ncbi:TPA: hypothetical protein ACXDAY_002205 [Clostridium botulinum]|uniref:hypothetical protein n=1 Tax=Clostridium botulinum TaxID=1491 RepID=UPI000773CCC7|nr:hypothetical protein [Clostridium botulinum]AUN01514.1 hypothetical protein RSJ19_00595 [Clostridium botulinum]MBN3352092.1 hypothetical protein [Clostridium botulinum]MBN3359230.1 hypothetical protein [Clostridium botulinum]MBN3371689.1 hypothetical protein [Clostridium botulinum]MBN3402873.1 hypothetical protein [Clostridium botulinum]